MAPGADECEWLLSRWARAGPKWKQCNGVGQVVVRQRMGGGKGKKGMRPGTRRNPNPTGSVCGVRWMGGADTGRVHVEACDICSVGVPVID